MSRAPKRLLCLAIPRIAQNPWKWSDTMRQRLPLLLFCCGLIVFAALAPVAFAQANQNHLRAYYATRPLNATPEQIDRAVGGAATLPMWRFNVTSSRDGNAYSGLMVGTDPSTNVTSSIPAVVVPIIFKMPDGTIFDPTQPDPCESTGALSDLQLVEGSPIFRNAPFNFGGTNVGNTQYIDAFQRASFWTGSPNGGSGVQTNTNEHTRLNIKVIRPVIVNVPTGGGKNWTGLGCGNFGVINLVWFDPGLFGITGPDYVLDRIIAPLVNKGVVAANTLPVLLFGNVVMGIQSTSPFFNCCVIGYHGAVLDANGNIQTYGPMDFDSTGAFGPAVADTTVMAHEVGEWMDDPTGGNPVPAWGHIGQQSGCQGNLEVGDPLTGTNMPDVTMPNGFTYHLQELAMFSWFMGAPSLAANGWYSSNNTFTTDAGAPCQ
jgi:hypothetical protein